MPVAIEFFHQLRRFDGHGRLGCKGLNNFFVVTCEHAIHLVQDFENACDFTAKGTQRGSQQSASMIPQGSHTFDVKATDAAGNTDPTPASYSWTVNAAVPDTVVMTGPSKKTKDTSATFTFDSPAPAISSAGKSIRPAALVVTFECSLDNSAFSACTSPKTYTRLKVGSHNFRVRVIADGVSDPSPAAFDWTIDKTAPTITITGKPSVISKDANPNFSFSSNEDSTFECSLDSVNGGAFAPCANPQQYFGVADGKRTFQVRAFDAAGNPAKKAAKYAWTVDATPPDTTITVMPANPTTSTSATFKFTSTEKKSTYQCNLDGAGFAICKSGQKYSGLLPGPHTFRVQATDPAGNTDGTPANFIWTIQ